MAESLKPGWTIQQAFERTLEPAHWHEFLEAAESWRQHGSPTRFLLGAGVSEDPDVLVAVRHSRFERELYRKHQATHAVVVSGFREHLKNGRLLAWGRRASPLANATPIPASAWELLKFNFAKSIAKEPHGGQHVYDVRIYPTLLAPQAAEALAGMSLRDVLVRYVFKDPELITAAKRTLTAAEIDYAFGHGLAPGRLDQFKWSLNCPRQEFVLQPLKVRSFYDPPLKFDMPPLIKPFLEHVLDRLTALRRLLAEGRLVGSGLHTSRGESTIIPSNQWARKAVWIDPREGDLVEELDDKTIMRWNGVTFHVNSTEHDSTAPAITEPHRDTSLALDEPLTALGAGIRMACRALYPTGVPKGLKAKDRDRAICKWLTDQGLSAPGTRTIQRYLPR